MALLLATFWELTGWRAYGSDLHRLFAFALVCVCFCFCFSLSLRVCLYLGVVFAFSCRLRLHLSRRLLLPLLFPLLLLSACCVAFAFAFAGGLSFDVIVSCFVLAFAVVVLFRVIMLSCVLCFCFCLLRGIAFPLPLLAQGCLSSPPARHHFVHQGVDEMTPVSHEHQRPKTGKTGSSGPSRRGLPLGIGHLFEAACGILGCPCQGFKAGPTPAIARKVGKFGPPSDFC